MLNRNFNLPLLLILFAAPGALAASPDALQGHRDCAQALHAKDRPSEEDGRSCITITGIVIIRQGRAGIPGFSVFSERTAFFIKSSEVPANILLPDGRKIRLEDGYAAKITCYEHTRTKPVPDDNLIGGKGHPLNDSLNPEAVRGLEKSLSRRLQKTPDYYRRDVAEYGMVCRQEGTVRHPHRALPPRRADYERVLEACLQGVRSPAFAAELSQTQSQLIQQPDLWAGVPPGGVPSGYSASAGL